MTTLSLERKQAWTVAELQAVYAEVEAAYRAALIAEDIVRTALKHRDALAAFYANIASAYRRFDLVTGKPTTNIALSAAVPHTTAARWVREARNRGHLERDER